MPLLSRKTLGSLQLGLNHPVSFLTKLSVRRSTLQGKQSRSYPLTNSTTPPLNYMLQKKIWAFGLDLTWYKQVNEQSSRATKLLGYLKKNTRFILRTEVRRTLYLALVKPHLGYATQIWAPQSIELIVKLERIQRRAIKFILKLPYSSNISYKSRLQTLNLITIFYWHELLDLTFFFKLTHGLVNVNSSVLPEVRKYGNNRLYLFREGKTLNSSPKTLMTLWPSKQITNIDSATNNYKIYYFQDNLG